MTEHGNTIDASYSPEDNKIRLRALHRLDSETYARVKAAGFIWAPKQDLFVAPAWSPEREDLALELADEIGDEDTSLVERSEERAERFDDYSEKRLEESERAHQAVAAIADVVNGNPILVGHHSEKRARKDAEKIQRGMAKAVALWETANYWERRAKGAIQHAKYKELPAVRARRIKGLEADERKWGRVKGDSERFLRAWTKEGLTRESAIKIANYDHLTITTASGESRYINMWSALTAEPGSHSEEYNGGPMTVESAVQLAVTTHTARIAGANRWLVHLGHRLTYERTMLEASGYQAPVKIKRTLPPIVNRPGGFEMTTEQWNKMYRDYKCTRVIDGERVRHAICGGAALDSTGSRLRSVFLTDAKVTPAREAKAS